MWWLIEKTLKHWRSQSKQVEVLLQDGRKFEGRVVNLDLYADIAIIKIKPTPPVPTAKLITSSSVRSGDWVLAVGYPFGLQFSVMLGCVRKILTLHLVLSTLNLGEVFEGLKHMEYLQTDCAIYPGSCGGPLANVYGDIVGVNAMIAGYEGIKNFNQRLNFAIPTDAVSQIIEQFKKTGSIVRPWLGLDIIDLKDSTIERLRKKYASFPHVRSGVLISEVSPSSPADRAGFCSGDVITEFAEVPIEKYKQVTEIMGDTVGEPFEVVVKRPPYNLNETLTVYPMDMNDPEL